MTYSLPLTAHRSLVGPPVSGILFQTFGFRAPFIFGIICTTVDLIGRLLIIEKDDAKRWQERTTAEHTPDLDIHHEKSSHSKINQQDDGKGHNRSPNEPDALPHAPEKITTWSGILRKLVSSPRVISACLITLFDG